MLSCWNIYSMAEVSRAGIFWSSYRLWMVSTDEFHYLLIFSFFSSLLLLLTNCSAPKWSLRHTFRNTKVYFFFLMSRADKLSVLLVHYRPSLLFKFRRFSPVADQYNNWRLQRWLIQAEYANAKFYKVKGVSTVFLTKMVKIWAFN